MCGLFVSVGTSAQFSRLRHRIAVTERGCYLSQTKQSGELFCRRDTMRQRQLPTTEKRSQVREHLSLCYFCTTTSPRGSSCSYLAVTLLSPVTFPLLGESLFEAPNEKIARCAVFLFLSAPLHSSLTRDTVSQ